MFSIDEFVIAVFVVWMMGMLDLRSKSQRYRLFFRAFEAPQQKSIFIVWLGYPRKEGDKNDCYRVFQKMVARGDCPESIDQLLLESESDP